jgi:hypothetical protein
MKIYTSFTARICATALAVLLLVLTAIGLTGCACGILGQDAWSGTPRCDQYQQSARDSQEQQSQRELPALQKRADAGDVNAQFAMGQFHVKEQHPNANRATGLAYYDKASRQGDVPSRRIFLTESLKDCREKSYKQGLPRNAAPPFAPYCATEWAAMETLAKSQCARTSVSNSTSSIQYELGQMYNWAGKSDDSDFWYVVAMTHCTTAAERSVDTPGSLGFSGFTVGPSQEGPLGEVRVAMWLGVRGMYKPPYTRMPNPEIEAKAKARLLQIQGQVARSGIRPAL